MTRFDPFEEIDGDDAEERLALGSIADQLERGRPIPAAGFRSRLKARLFSRRSEQGEAARTRVLALACAGLGTALLVVAALGTVAIGPFSA